MGRDRSPRSADAGNGGRRDHWRRGSQGRVRHHASALREAARGPGRGGAGIRQRVRDPCVSCFVRSEEHTSELQSLMRISYAVFCLKKKNNKYTNNNTNERHI